MAQQLPVILLAALALGGCATASTTRDEGADPRLAAILQGRTAGPPQDCIDLRQARGSTVTRDAIVFRESRRVVWVSDSPGCSRSSNDPILVTRTFGTRLCRGEIVQTIDRASRFPGQSCPLGAFTPYRLPARLR
jgi:hypothetical protein